MIQQSINSFRSATIGEEKENLLVELKEEMATI